LFDKFGKYKGKAMLASLLLCQVSILVVEAEEDLYIDPKLWSIIKLNYLPNYDRKFYWK